MFNEIFVLAITAASVGFIHTLLGPDHYLPFIVMAKANKWSHLKTFWITIACGLGHVGSSIILGFIGIALGLALSGIEAFEEIRGSLAAWLFIGFGLAYFIWGLRKAIKNNSHTHKHLNVNGLSAEHDHISDDELQDEKSSKNKNLTPWVLFTIFVFGPCEPLVPLFIYPAAEHNILAVIIVVGFFTLATILTMLVTVFLPLLGLNVLPQKSLERYMHAIAGGTLLMSGIGIQFMGL